MSWSNQPFNPISFPPEKAREHREQQLEDISNLIKRLEMMRHNGLIKEHQDLADVLVRKDIVCDENLREMIFRQFDDPEGALKPKMRMTTAIGALVTKQARLQWRS